MPARSEPLRSYFDTTLGSVFFNIPGAAIPEVRDRLTAAREARRESEEKREEYFHSLMAWVRVRHYPLLAHEWGHVLQVLTHPALFLRCLREFSAICTVGDELRKAPEAAPIPLAPSLAWIDEMRWPTTPVRISIDEEGMPNAEAATSRPMRGDLSETDLLEDSASIFQYRAEIGSEGAVDGYRRWLNEGRKYLYAKTFDFVRSVLPPADAYVALVPLVMAAYATAWPVHSFVSLLALTAREAPARPAELGVDRYWRYLQLVLEHLLPTGRTPEPRRHIYEENEQRRIDRGDMIEMARGMPNHPMSAVVELAWKDRESIERLHDAILHPYRAFNRRQRAAEEWLEPFRPAVTAFRLLDEGAGVGDTALYISPTVASGGYQPGGLNWQEYLIQMMRIKAFVFATTTPFLRSRPHNCHHMDCPYHQLDMCRGWMNIPSTPEACGFPVWLGSVMNRRVDFESKMLVPVD